MHKKSHSFNKEKANVLSPRGASRALTNLWQFMAIYGSMYQHVLVQGLHLITASYRMEFEL